MTTATRTKTRRKIDDADPFANVPIVDLNDDEPEYTNVLVIADSGQGKTPFAGSAKRGLLIATEAGVVSAKRWGSTMKLWQCPTWNDFVAAKEFLHELAEKPGGITAHFDWVSLDGLTMAQTKLLRQVLQDETDLAPTERGNEKGLDIPQIQDHQLIQNRFKRYIAEMLDLPVNFCATALPMNIETVDPEGDTSEVVLPQILGQKGAIAWHIVGLFSAGGKMELRKRKLKDGTIETYQRIWWKKQGAWWGRDRYDALGNYTDNITLDEIAAKVAARSEEG